MGTDLLWESVSPENIETCNGVAVGDEKTRTCALCVALNDTVFRNDNKPIYYHSYDGNIYTTLEMNEIIKIPDIDVHYKKVDWREIIYQMALDYFKHGQEEDFLYKV